MTTAEAMTYLGVQANGCLAPCPVSPRGVGSCYPEDSAHFLEPISFEGDGESAKRRLLAIFQTFHGIELVEEGDDYLHFERESFVFRLVSDVECLVDEKRQLVHFRSVQRYGYWDGGANARLMKKVKTLFGRITV